ncbi:MAG: FAD-binding oxidoreductase [Deltaproteobacteria bacterium]|nr:FAD-binding oxidoreductase [Deltaproteobacteria bacterium]
MKTLINDLQRLLSADQVSDGAIERRAYAHDLWPRQLIARRGGLPRPAGPSAVVWPHDEHQVAAVLRYAASHGVKIAPFGGGSGVCGMTVAEPESIVLDTKRMRRVHSVDLTLGQAEIDAGILGQHLEDTLLARGATMGHYPSSIACSTLGGWIVTRGAGQCSGRYGKVEDMVLSVEGILPTGEPFTAGAPAPGEIDARALMVGSEGLFGVVTRATMRVWPAPKEQLGVGFTFATLSQAWDAVRALYQSGLRPAVCRVYDPLDSYIFRTGKRRSSESEVHAPGAPNATAQWLLRRVGPASRLFNAINARHGERLFGRSLLIVIFECTEAERDMGREALAQAQALCVACGGQDEGDAPAKRWISRRHSVSYRQPATYAKGLWVDTMEVAAPWSRFKALYEGVRAALAQGGLVMAHMSHAYTDGCSIYFTFVGASPTDERALERYDLTWAKALLAAHSAGGTIAHHHGIGRSKRGAMGLEHGDGLSVLRALAAAADPFEVLSGGPLLPEPFEGFPAPTIPEPRDAVSVDAFSRTVTVRAETEMRAVHSALARHDLQLPDAPTDGTLQQWLARVQAAEVFADPLFRRVSGYVAHTPSGGVAHLLSAPRRAAGPELMTLFASGKGRFGSLQAVTLTVHSSNSNGVQFCSPFTPSSARTSQSIHDWIDRAAGAPTS